MPTLKVSVAKPCYQNWQDMLPHDAGRYCPACRKNVVDFTSMTDQEVYQFLQKSQGEVCGRLRKDQVKVYPAPAHASRRLRLHLLALATFIGLKSAIPDEAKAQQPLEQQQPDFSTVARAADPASVQTDSLSVGVVSGSVFSEDDKMPIPRVNILVKGTQTGTLTDADGNYTLVLREWNDQKITLIYSFIGYQTVERQMQLNREKKLNVEMELDNRALMGEVMVIRYPFPKNIMMLPARLFYKAKCLINR